MLILISGKDKRKRDSWEDLEVGGRIILIMILDKQDWILWAAFIWLRMGCSGGLF
jgi:hypothetical protein